MGRVVVTRRLPGNAVQRLYERHDVEVWPEPRPPDSHELVKLLRGADALVSLVSDRIDAELLANCPSLKVIANYAVGYDNIDVVEATKRGIPVGNTPDVLTEATADLTFALLLAASRHIVEASAAVRAGQWTTWDPNGFLGETLHGTTLLVIGFGRIGRAVAARAAAFGMRVIPLGSSSRKSLFDVLPTADYVTLHCPLTPDTYHLIDSAPLRRMKDTAILVNTARGGLVNSDALVQALLKDTIRGAALDVTEPEPLPVDHPLLSVPSVLVTPHIGSATSGARAAMATLTVANILAGLDGQPPPYCVNPEVYLRDV